LDVHGRTEKSNEVDDSSGVLGSFVFVCYQRMMARKKRGSANRAKASLACSHSAARTPSSLR
jgi:hypothetical protein